MPDDNIMMEGGKVLAGAAIFIILFTALSISTPFTHPLMEEDDVEPTILEKIKDFIMSFPYNFCIGGILVILSLLASYYSKVPAATGELLRILGPFQGYIFGFGLVLIFVPFI